MIEQSKGNPSHTRSEHYILIVDDNWMNRELLETILTAARFRVRVVSSGERALDVAYTDPPALVLLDVRHFDLDGYEVCHRLTADPRTRAVPVVMVTAYNSDADHQRAVSAGALAFLEKSYDAAKLLATIESLLRQK